LDEEVLFADTCNGPDADDDLEEGDDYLDISEAYDLQGQEIIRASMRSGVFQLGFKSGVELRFEQNGEETRLECNSQCENNPDKSEKEKVSE